MYSKKQKQIALHLLTQLQGGRSIQLFCKKYPKIFNKVKKLTCFLPNSSFLIERLYCISNDINIIPTCKTCNTNNVKWEKNKREYMLFCSLTCKGKNDDIKLKVKNTVQIRFGVDNVSQNLMIKNQKQQTSLKNHGVLFPLQNKNVRIKSIRTNQEKFGVNYPLQNSEIRENFKQTLIKKYGVDNPSKVQDFQNKKKKTCIDKYGKEHFSQKHIPDKILLLLNDKNWLIDQHITQQKSLLQIGKELNVWDATIARYLHNFNIETHNYFSSSLENEIVNFIKSFYNGSIIQNSRQIISPKEIDIFLPELNIAIEFCGLFWHCDFSGKSKFYHKDKFDQCKNLGIRLITIYEDEWNNKQKIIKRFLVNLINPNNNKIAARNCSIVNVDRIAKKIFLDQNHIQGNGSGSITYGLQYKNDIVACMTFIKKSNKNFELNRYATTKTIVGGFSRLLAFFKSQHQWNSIITFADVRYFTGNVYQKTGFSFVRHIDPTYEYIIQGKRYHRSNFRRKQIQRLYPETFDSTLSEHENMNNLNIPKIWNCGLLKFVMSQK